jgi:hypothetical protein
MAFAWCSSNGCRPAPSGYLNRMSPFSLVIGLVAVLAIDQQPTSRRPTLIEWARQHPGMEWVRFACGYVGEPPTFESVVGGANVIVHGTVVAADGRLTADAQEVWTDYHVQPIELIREGTPPLRSSPIVFTGLGGTVIVEGLTITVVVQQNGREIRLKPGDEVVLFGTMREHLLTLDPVGVFTVLDGEVRPNGDLPGFSTNQQSVRLETFLTRVRPHP